MTPDTCRWADRVIPMPKEICVDGSVKIRAADLRVVCDAPEDPPIKTAKETISRFALGNEAARFTIRLTIDHVSAPANSDQAYSIRSANGNSGLILLANNSVGLLYAARTLEQLVAAPKEVGPDTLLEVPIVTVTDWPDIGERGQWGGDAWRHLDEFSCLKLNVLELDARVSLDPNGKARAEINREVIEKGRRLGVKVVPYILHLEQISQYSGVSKRADIVSKPDPSKPLPSDYVPGLCMSSPATRELIADWLEVVAQIDGVTDITVWLSEERAPCFCEKCVGKEPFELEVQAVVEAFRKVQTKHPNARLRLLTTQGSYPVNDKILAAAPPDVGIIYYDGVRTYDSSKKPMIYPLLEEAVKSGRWLGVYPQITHSWRTVWPWTAPQFINYRATEFASKKLSNVIGYAVPSNYHHAFNVAALAEWTWNSKGRSPEEFARVYAIKNGISDPDLFSRWAMAAGEAGWALADSGLMLAAIYNPKFDLAGGARFAERFANAYILDDAEFKKAFDIAWTARDLAKQLGIADAISESECTFAGLLVFDILKTLSPLVALESPDPKQQWEIEKRLYMLEECMQTIRKHILEWGERVQARSGASRLPCRLCDTAYVLFRTYDAYSERADKLDVLAPYTRRRLKKIGGWTAEDFRNGQTSVITVDISRFVPAKGGKYQVGFDFVDSAYGTDIKSVSVVQKDGESEKVLAISPDPSCRVSKHERWHEMRIDIPARENDSPVFLRVELSGLPSDAPEDRRSCSGTIGIRQVD